MRKFELLERALIEGLRAGTGTGLKHIDQDRSNKAPIYERHGS
jgi:hypothetical protein